MQYFKILSTVGFTFCLMVLALLTTAALTPVTVQAVAPADGIDIYYVAPDCTGVPAPCFTAIQAAVDAVDVPTATIKVAAGHYTDINTYEGLSQVVYLSKTLTLQGGYTTTDWVAAHPLTQPTILDAEQQGRVFYITGAISPTVDGFHITGGHTQAAIGYDGGGIYISNAALTLRHSWVFSNTSDSRGGGIYLDNSASTIEANQIFSNTAMDRGGGLYLDSSSATLNQNAITGNHAYSGGGAYLSQSPATLQRNTVSSNEAANLGGGLFVGPSAATLDGNVITGNRSQNGGGGLDLDFSNALVMNTIVADNWAKTLGSGINVCGNAQLLHTTIVRNTGGDGAGIRVSCSGANATVALTNTILVGHSVGVTVTTRNTLTMESTLWGSNAWANGLNWGGNGTIITGIHNFTGDPAFINPAASNYHVSLGSAAIDKGANANITTDIDGDLRPFGSGYDLGADECTIVLNSHIYLPLTLKSTP